MDIRPPMDVFTDAFGVPATVTRPNEAAIETTAIWLSPLQELQPSGGLLQRREPIKVLALRKSEVPTVPMRTAIVAPEFVDEFGDGELAGWIVDGYEQGDSEHHRVIVVPDPNFVES